MRAVVIGSSLFARELAKKLKKKDHHIILLIEDKEAALEISAKDTGLIVVHGDPTDTEILEQLELDKCECFVSATESEETNILSALYAKNKGVAHIYVRTSNLKIERLLKRMGLIAVNSEKSAATSVSLDILKPLVSELVDVEKGEFNIIQKDLSNYKNLIGKKLGLMQGDFFVVLAVHNYDKFLFAADTVLEEGAKLIILYEYGKLKDLDKALKKM